MNEYVTDTHALLWHILSSSKLSPAAALIFKQTDENEARIYIPTIVLVETVYLMEKARVPKSAFARSTEFIPFFCPTKRNKFRTPTALTE